VSQPLLIRDAMRIGVPTCKLWDPVALVAAQMAGGGHTAVVVLDEDGDTRGWINERMLAEAWPRLEGGRELVAGDIMDEQVPECPSDVPLSVAVQVMADFGADHLFFLHRAGGRVWPASVLNLGDIVRAAAGPDFLAGQGIAAPRPTPMDLFRERYRKPSKAG
jgi:CBS domain-containing protein